MNKIDYPILVVGDLHLKSSNLWIAKMFFYKLNNIIKEYKIKSIVFLGDAYDNKSIIYGEVQNFFLHELDNFAPPVNVFVVTGNHDLIHQNSEETSLQALKYCSMNITVVDKIEEYENFLFVPYNRDSKIIENALNQYNNKTVFGHFNFKGDLLGNYPSEDGVAVNNIKTKHDYILGHFHTPNGPYLGSPWSHSFNEANQNKRLWVIQEDKNIQTILLNLPKHVVLEYGKYSEGKFDKSDIIKVINVPINKIQEVKHDFSEFKDLQIVALPELKNDVRLDINKDILSIIKDYCNKCIVAKDNLLYDKDVLLDKIMQIYKEIEN